LDEPTNGLDIPAKGSFRRLLIEAFRPERSFIISTHQIADIQALVDRITIVNEGKILFDHSTEEIERILHMKRSDTEPAPGKPGLLYSEATRGGYWSVWQGPSPEGGALDLEILFNAVLSNKKLAGELSEGGSE
ncbi:MAG: ABC transporter ATP-binding protein, partial [Spirochaetota bacterium]